MILSLQIGATVVLLVHDLSLLKKSVRSNAMPMVHRGTWQRLVFKKIKMLIPQLVYSQTM